MHRKYDNLRYFCSYFGPTWKSDFGDISGAVKFFLDTSNTVILQKVKADIDYFLEEFKEESELLLELAALGSVYSPKASGLTYRGWLQQIQNEIHTRLSPPQHPISQPISQPKYSTSGIPGNTSDDRLRRGQDSGIIVFAALIICAILLYYRYKHSGLDAPEQKAGADSNKVHIEHRNDRVPVKKTARLSRVSMVHHSTISSSNEELFRFWIDLYKRDGWIDTGIPVVAGNFLFVFAHFNQEQQLSALTKIGKVAIPLRLQGNNIPTYQLELAIMDHEVEIEHVILAPKQMETVKFKLNDIAEKDHVRLDLTLTIFESMSTADMRQRELAVLNQFSKEPK